MQTMLLFVMFTFVVSCKPLAESGAVLATDDSLEADKAALLEKDQDSVYIDTGERDRFGKPILKRLTKEEASRGNFGEVVPNGGSAFYTEQAKQAIRDLEREINIQEGRSMKNPNSGVVMGASTQTKNSDVRLQKVLKSAVQSMDNSPRSPNDRLRSSRQATVTIEDPNGGQSHYSISSQVMSALIETRAAKHNGLIDPSYEQNPFAAPFISLFSEK